MLPILHKKYIFRHFSFNAILSVNDGKKCLFAEHYYITVFPLEFLSGGEVDPQTYRYEVGMLCRG